MIRLYLILLVIAVFLWLKVYWQKPASDRPQYIKKSMLLGVMACLLLLAITGKLNWVLAAFSVVVAFILRFLPVLLRYAPQLQKLWGMLRQYGFFAQKQAKSASGLGKMTRDEAYKILGLSVSATDKEIIAAHRQLILKNHPDRGGSSYLAAQINLAKDILLKR